MKIIIANWKEGPESLEMGQQLVDILYSPELSLINMYLYCGLELNRTIDIIRKNYIDQSYILSSKNKIVTYYYEGVKVIFTVTGTMTNFIPGDKAFFVN